MMGFIATITIVFWGLRVQENILEWTPHFRMPTHFPNIFGQFTYRFLEVCLLGIGRNKDPFLG